jgi:catechol 2,3-dioxygenase-like lactoylglutathione lyase family enzyme
VIQGMNHFTITAEDRAATLAYYCGLLGFVEGQRPDLGFPGSWLYAPGGTHAILHIYWDRPMPATRTGVIDHMAFTASDLKAVKARFDAAGVKYVLQQQAGAGTWQLFSHDPNGAKVELDFDPDERP